MYTDCHGYNADIRVDVPTVSWL